MDLDARPLVRRRINDELLRVLEAPDVSGVLVLGAAASGKTSLLRMVEEDLDVRGRAVFLVGSVGLRDPGDLGARILDAIAASSFSDAVEGGRTVGSSAGAPTLHESALLLRDAALRLPSPVLLLDGLDEALYPLRLAAAVEELSEILENWKFVVASRPQGIAESRSLSHFRELHIEDLDEDEIRLFIEMYGEELPTAVLRRAAQEAGNSPLLLRLLIETSLRYGSVAPDASPRTYLARFVMDAITNSPEPPKLRTLLEQLALAGREDRIASLAAKSQMSEDEVHQLLSAPQAQQLVLFTEGRTVALVHPLVADVILTQRIFATPVRLCDLAFGSEEAERDELLDQAFVPRASLKRIADDRRSIVIGDRGSGKSAIFRKLADGDPARTDTHVVPVADTADLMQRIIGDAKNADAESLRAAWLVIVASTVATVLPAAAPKGVRKTASNVRTALGLAAPQAGTWRRWLRTAAQSLAGTTVRFAVGPVNLEAQLPSGSTRIGRRTVDVEAFLRDVDRLFDHVTEKVTVLVDRIDEMFKYDRKKQEALVQALLAAEARISLLHSIGLVVFIRTDLFELYDIQEKTKLVSRTLTLEWSDEDWLQLLLNRVLANPAVHALGESLQNASGPADLQAALHTLFPEHIEGQPIDRWLIDSVRNGNGDVSPRLAVLLLHLAREMSPNSTLVVLSLVLGVLVKG
jgi:hypothetical protein